jgi:hypothetical protein
MNPRVSAIIIVLLSIAYGITVGILGALNSPATTTFAIIGAFVLAGLWVMRSLLNRGRST